MLSKGYICPKGLGKGLEKGSSGSRNRKNNPIPYFWKKNEGEGLSARQAKHGNYLCFPLHEFKVGMWQLYTVSESSHRAIPFKIAGISVEMEYFIQICWYTTPLLTYTHISVYTSRHCIYPVHCLLSCASIGRYILHLVLNLVLQQLLKYKTYEAIFVKEKKREK